MVRWRVSRVSFSLFYIFLDYLFLCPYVLYFLAKFRSLFSKAIFLTLFCYYSKRRKTKSGTSVPFSAILLVHSRFEACKAAKPPNPKMSKHLVIRVKLGQDCVNYTLFIINTLRLFCAHSTSAPLNGGVICNSCVFKLLFPTTTYSTFQISCR